jgi:hypothetical protein
MSEAGLVKVLPMTDGQDKPSRGINHVKTRCRLGPPSTDLAGGIARSPFTATQDFALYGAGLILLEPIPLLTKMIGIG